jgi:hypothetical protein
MPIRCEIHHGISEKVRVSDYENSYVGAVKRLNAISPKISQV